MDQTETSPIDDGIKIGGTTIKLSLLERMINIKQPESAEKFIALGSTVVLWVMALSFTALAIVQGAHICGDNKGAIAGTVQACVLALAAYLVAFGKMIHLGQQKVEDTNVPSQAPPSGGPQ